MNWAFMTLSGKLFQFDKIGLFTKVVKIDWFFIEISQVFADFVNMVDTDFKYFKYEMVLGNPIPMPKPEIEYFPRKQYSVQQYLHTLCKVHIGALGKVDGKWEFGEGPAPKVPLGPRQDVVQIFNYAEDLGIIVPAEGVENADQPGTFIPYQLSKSHWSRFDKFAE